MAEPEITQEVIDQAKARDDRWKDVDLAVQIEAEAKRSPLLRIVFGMARREKAQALEQLATVDPGDFYKIRLAQAMVYRADFITAIVDNILAAGQQAYEALNEETKSYDVLNQEQEVGEYATGA